MELKLKITIIAPSPGEEEEIIFRCHTLTDEMKQLVYRLEHGDMKLTGYDENGIYPLEASDVYYFEATDNKVFAYCERDVYEVREKLYQLEELLVSFSFMRASKSMILNLNKITSPSFTT
jgi:DNA-binding LytR/AlgR family response regulator